jgi:tetratricopeptide (TPR) repeat protein
MRYRKYQTRMSHGSGQIWLYALVFALLLSTCLPSGATESTLQTELRRIYEQADVLITSNKPAEAIPLLEKAVALSPSSPLMHNTLGVAYQNSRRTEQAIVEYKKVLELLPQSTTVYLNIAHCYGNLKQYDEAISWYDKYLSRLPPSADKGKIEAERKDVVFRKHITEGIEYLKAGRNLDARQAFQQAVLLKPDFGDAHFKLATALNLSGDPGQAIGEFEESLRLDPKQTDACYNIAVCYQNLGDIEQSIKWYQRFLRENPDSPMAANIPNKIEALRKASREFRNDPSAYDYLDSIISNRRYYRWPHEVMPITVYIQPPIDVAGYRPEFGQALIDALEIWAKATGNRLAFLLVPERSQARVICEWTSDPARVSDEGKAVEQGWTKVHGQTTPYGIILIDSAIIRILTKPRKGARDLSDDDVKKACLHEVGHMLGLNGHSSNNHDVMFFSESPSVWPALSKRDKATILRLYQMYPERLDLPTVGYPN